MIHTNTIPYFGTYNTRTTDNTNTTDIASGIFCGRCGTKMYLSADGSHRRCPSCDDRSD